MTTFLIKARINGSVTEETVTLSSPSPSEAGKILKARYPGAKIEIIRTTEVRK